MNRFLRFGCIASVFSFAALAAEGDLTWFKFNKQFITSQFAADVAFGSVAATKWSPAANVHDISCGGKDGELHIGIFDGGIDVTANQQPVSARSDQDDSNFGIVAELPNAAEGDGPDLLATANGQRVSFQGYFRVWDEGHSTGAVHPSNPHHVLEVHPAWGFSGEGVQFQQKDLVKAIPGYSGYGASKFRELFRSLDNEEWLHVFQDDTNVFVELRQAANFFQLPIEVKEVREVQGGHEASVDVFSDAKFQNRIHENLRCITVNDSRADTRWKAGDRTFVLGFFSVNLRKALDASASAKSENDAVAAPDALEFFVFGRPLEQAVSSSKCKPEPDEP